jgi:hypothetical protein
MKKSTKIISLSLSGLLVIGLLLTAAIGALAATSVTVTGLLAAGATPNQWTVNGEPVTVDASTVCNNVSACSALEAGMLVTAVKDSTTNVAATISVLDHFAGTITALADGNTTWTVKDDQGNAFDFSVSSDLWPLVFGVGDQVSISFTFENGDLVATAVQVDETAVPDKTESARCTNDKSNQPALAKLASQIFATLPADSGYESATALQADLVDYFCKGFGVGEIMQAFKYSADSQYTAQMLLALRAQGSGWGQLKKLAKANPQIVEGTTVAPTTTQSMQGKANKPDKSLKPAKADKPGKSDQHGKADNPGKSGQHGKADNPGKSGQHGKK